MQQIYKDKVFSTLKQFGIAPNDADHNAIERQLDGWEKARPVRINHDTPSGNVQLQLTQERHFKKTMGGGSCRGHRCHESYSGVKVNAAEVDHYLFEVPPEGLMGYNRTTGLSSVFQQFAMGGGKEDPELSKSNTDPDKFLDMDVTKIAVKSLTEGLVSYLEMSGCMSDSDIKDNDQLELLRSKLTNILAQAELRRRADVYNAFVGQTIAPEVLDILQASQNDNAKTFNWLMADGDSEHQKYRLQVAQSYPLFLKVMTDDHLGYNYSYYSHRQSDEERLARENFSSDRKTLAHNIDAAQSVTEQLGKALKESQTLSKRTVKSLGKIKEYPQGLDYNKFLNAVFYLDGFDNNWHPKNVDELSSFVNCVERAEKFAKILGRSADDILKKTKGRWAEWEEKTVSLQAVHDISDWVDELQKSVILPHILSQLSDDLVHVLTDKEAFAKARGSRSHYSTDVLDQIFKIRESQPLESILSKVSELDILECSLRWHEQGETYSARKQSLGIANLNDLDNWLPLSEPMTSPVGVLITPLTSKAELNAEGDAMGHCVGWNGYDARCLTKNDHILSVSEDGKRLSTIQLREEFNAAGKVKGLEVIQNQGAGRDRAKKAVDWYIRELFKNKSVAPDWDAIEASRIDNRQSASKAGLAARIGFDPLVDVYRSRAFENFQPYLPARFRALDYTAFLEMPKFSETILFENTQLYSALEEAGLSMKPRNAGNDNDMDEPVRLEDVPEKSSGIWGSFKRQLGL